MATAGTFGGGLQGVGTNSPAADLGKETDKK